MASKKIYFYTATLFDSNDKQCPLSQIPITYAAVKKHSKKLQKSSYPCITSGTIADHIAFDIVNDRNNLLLGRLSKSGDPNYALKRNLQSGEVSRVIPDNENNVASYETCTFFAFDLSKGIVGFIPGKSAPPIKDLSIFWNLEGYVIKFEHIMHPDSVELLKKPGSTLSSVTVRLAKPEDALLQALHFPTDFVDALHGTDCMEFNIEIRNSPRKKLTRASKAIKDIIQSCNRFSKPVKDRLIFNGSTTDSATQKFVFGKTDLVFSTTLNFTKTESGKRLKMPLDEAAQLACNKIVESYNTHRKAILAYSGKIKE